MASSKSQHGRLAVICLRAPCIFSRSEQMAYEMLLTSGLSVFKQVACILCSHSQFVLSRAWNLKEFCLFKDAKSFLFLNYSVKHGAQYRHFLTWHLRTLFVHSRVFQLYTTPTVHTGNLQTRQSGV